MDDLVLKKCPVCRARFKGQEAIGQPCHRCNADLQHVRSAHLHAQQWQNQARLALHNQQPIVAIHAAKQALVHLNVASTRQTYTAALVQAELFELAQSVQP